MINKDKQNATAKRGHKERVAMREILRNSKYFNQQTTNDELDYWLYRHGYLQSFEGKLEHQQIPENRVERLRKRMR